MSAPLAESVDVFNWHARASKSGSDGFSPSPASGSTVTGSLMALWAWRARQGTVVVLCIQVRLEPIHLLCPVKLTNHEQRLNGNPWRIIWRVA